MISNDVSEKIIFNTIISEVFEEMVCSRIKQLKEFGYSESKIIEELKKEYKKYM